MTPTPEKAMTAEERWKRFQAQIYALPNVVNPINLRDGFFAEIESAERQGYKRGVEDSAKLVLNSQYAIQAFDTILDVTNPCYQEMLSADIRKLAEGEK